MTMKRTEHGEQAALIEWAAANQYRIPELAMLFAVPNAGKRRRGAAGRMIAEGLKAGVPDLILLVARKGYHGLLIEMKTETGKVSQAQHDWLVALQKQGYYAKVCRSFEAAREMIEIYLASEQGTELDI
jgi:hypothetical protein